MELIANKTLYMGRGVTVNTGEVFTVTRPAARHFLRLGYAREYETKVIVPEVTVARATTGDPLVSCIMPTADRRRFISGSIRQFLRQTYNHKELVILDDGADPVENLIPPSPDVRYIRAAGAKAPIGAKRNMLCEQARGEVIAHWDDDDWSCPTRLAEQIQIMLDHPEVSITGYRSLLFWDERKGGQAWRYNGRRNYAVGTSLMYRRAYWERHRFPEMQIGEDSQFVHSAAPGVVYAIDGERRMVARIHKGTTAPKLGGREWVKVEKSELPEIE